MNPRIKYDGLNWYITVWIKYEDSGIFPSNEGIGIDKIPDETGILGVSGRFLFK